MRDPESRTGLLERDAGKVSFTRMRGYLSGGSDLPGAGEMTIGEAKEKAQTMAACLGFTYNDTVTDDSDVAYIYFKSKFELGVQGSDELNAWTSWRLDVPSTCDEHDFQRWDEELAAMQVSGVTEAELHQVPWGAMLLDFIYHILVCILLAGYSVFVDGMLGGNSPTWVWVFIYPASFGFVLMACLMFYQNLKRGQSELWEVVRGTKRIKLTRQLHVWMIAKALLVEKSQNEETKYRLGRIAISEEDQRMLVLHGDEIEPEEYELISVGSDEATDALKYIVEYTDCLLEVAGSSSAQSVQKRGKLQQTWVEFWIQRHTMDLVRPEKPLWATFRRRTYLAGLQQHFVVRLFVAATLAFWLMFPSVLYIREIQTWYTAMCSIGEIHDSLWVGDFKICETSGCNEVCSTLSSFEKRVRESMHISVAEMLLNWALVAIVLLMSSVKHAEQGHLNLEISYLFGLSIPKRLIHQVVEAKMDLENVLHPLEVVKMWFKRLRIWMDGSDSGLGAYGPMAQDQEQVSGEANHTLASIIKPLKAMRSSRLFCEFKLPRFSNSLEDGISVLDLNRQACNEWAMRADQYQLRCRDFKVVMDILVETNETWESILEFFKNEQHYKKQLQCIFNPEHKGCKDGYGPDVGVKKSFRVGAQVIPEGFVLTHVYVAELGTGRIISKELGPDLMTYDHFVNYAAALSRERGGGLGEIFVFEDTGHWVVLHSSRDDEWTSAVPNWAIPQIGLRFQLTEPYFRQKISSSFMFQDKSAAMEAYMRQCLGGSDNGQVQSMYQKVFTPSLDQSTEDVPIQRTTKSERSRVTVIMGDSDQGWKVLQLSGILLQKLILLLLCAFFPLTAPLMRHFLDDIPMFPRPFPFVLSLNALLQFAALTFFFYIVETVTARLSTILKLLLEFERETLCFRSSSLKMQEAGDDDSKQSKEDPFSLYITDTKTKYEPLSDYWKKQWQNKAINVQNWSFCTKYFRVFVSSVRLSIETVLVAASMIALLVGLLLLTQSLHGKGPVQMHVFGDAASAAPQQRLLQQVDAAHLVQDPWKEQIAQASVVVAQWVALSAPANGCGSDVAVARVSEAAQNLRSVLRPFKSALVAVHEQTLTDFHRRLEGLKDPGDSKDSPSNLLTVDVAKTTKSGVLGIMMILLISFYVIPLLHKIAQINDAFSRHAGLLRLQKEEHEDLQRQREENASALPAKDLSKQRYEKMLDGAISSAEQGVLRFPLKLFGFVINTMVLTTWIAVAASPVIKKLKEELPKLVKSACERVSSFSKINKDLIYDAVCEPLLEKGMKYFAGKEDERRLEAIPLIPLIEEWWRRNLLNDAMKALVVNITLAELASIHSPQAD